MSKQNKWRYDHFTWLEIKEVIARTPQPVVCTPFGTVDHH